MRLSVRTGGPFLRALCKVSATEFAEEGHSGIEPKSSSTLVSAIVVSALRNVRDGRGTRTAKGEWSGHPPARLKWCPSRTALLGFDGTSRSTAADRNVRATRATADSYARSLRFAAANGSE